jgi:lipoprotein NlpI
MKYAWWFLLVFFPLAARADEPPLPAESLERMQQSFRRDEDRLADDIALRPDDVRLYSRRGDVRFFQGKFTGALADYEKMVELEPKLEVSHWRRGIAYFYAEDYDKAARQFELYHEFDDVDRENGIWRYLSQVKAIGRDKARSKLLKYSKVDREPLPAVYKLFAGEITPQEILDGIAAAEIPAEERVKRLFYAQLYIGLNHLVEDDLAAAQRHLAEAVRNEWGRTIGGGPTYMWHVARLQEERLRTAKK